MAVTEVLGGLGEDICELFMNGELSQGGKSFEVVAKVLYLSPWEELFT